MHQPTVYKVGDNPAVASIGNDRCCCGSMHVQRGAIIIGWIGIVFSALGLISAIAAGHIATLIVYLINLFVHIALVMAQSRGQPGLYVPYLILNGISVVLTPLYILGGIAAFIWMPQLVDAMGDSLKDAMRSAHQQASDDREQLIAFGRLFSASVVIGGAIGEALAVWFQWVVWRAYKIMKATLSQSFVTYGPNTGTYNVYKS